MKIGVIGLGAIGERHVKNLQALYPRASIEILTSRARWDGASVQTTLVTSATRFFKTRHDVYLVTNETGKHASTILKCVAQKPKGIFVEKPLCLSAREVARIRRALTNYKGVFFVGYCFHFFKPIVYLKKLLAEKKIGNVFSMRVSVGQDLRTWGKPEFLKGFRSKRVGGGAILDLIHDINYPAWILGQTLTYITGAYGRMTLPIEADDISESLFRASGGALVSIHQDYLQRPGGRSCEILGARGSIVWTRSLRKGTTTDEIRIHDENKSTLVQLKTNPADMYKDEVRFFINATKAGKRFSNFEEAARDIQNVLQLKGKAKRVQ